MSFKIGIISSPGGHLTEVRCLEVAYGRYPHFYVLNDEIPLSKELRGKTYFITHAERNVKQVLNLFEAYRILARERPDVLLSTGASPIVPFAIIGRAFFNTKVIFVETISRVEKPSLTGRLMYYLAHRFYFQHRSLAAFFPRGEYHGSVV